MLDITLEPLYDHQYQQNVQFMPLHLPWTLHCKNNRLVRKDYRSWFPSLISSSEKFTRNLNGNGKKKLHQYQWNTQPHLTSNHRTHRKDHDISRWKSKSLLWTGTQIWRVETGAWVSNLPPLNIWMSNENADLRKQYKCTNWLPFENTTHYYKY
jgi:hypothetical protein